MDIHRVCVNGYFDRVIVDGWVSPLYNARGIQLNSSSESFEESVYMASKRVSQGVSLLSIKVIGESDDTECQSEIERMNSYRESKGIERVKYGSKSRYTIATAQVFIVRNQLRKIDKVLGENKVSDDAHKSFKKEQSVNLIAKAIDIQDTLRIKYKKHEEKIPNIAVIDEVFVEEEFRRCGISTYIHENIKSLVEILGLTDIKMVLLTPGDFTDTASKYGMTNDEYLAMLTKSYEKLGYRKLNRLERFGIMRRDL